MIVIVLLMFIFGTSVIVSKNHRRDDASVAAKSSEYYNEPRTVSMTLKDAAWSTKIQHKEEEKGWLGQALLTSHNRTYFQRNEIRLRRPVSPGILAVLLKTEIALIDHPTFQVQVYN